MATWLKQSTAREIKLGPFVDQTDGFTAETGLTIAQADVRLAKNEGDWAQKNESTTLVHEENGWYRCLLNSTDTDTLGILIVAVNESGALPVWREFLVVPAQVWDSFLGADLLQVDLAQWLGTAAATPTVAGVPEVDVTHAAGSAQASIATQASVNTIDDFLDTETGTILADLDDIQTRLPAALVGGRMASNAEVVGDKTGYALTTAERTAIIDELAVRKNTAQAGAATTITLDASASAVDDFYNEMYVVLIGGTGAGQARRITDYVGASKVATVQRAWATNPDGTTVFRIFGDAFTGILAGGIVASSFALDAIDAAAIKADAGTELADALLDRASAAEGFTVRQLLRLYAAALLGKADGFPLGPVHYRDVADTKNRITGSIDATGNRTSVTLDAS